MVLARPSYLKTFCRSNQQSFTSLCFCVMPAARPGWRFDSWDMLTSSICHTQASTLGREGFCSTPLTDLTVRPYHDLAGDVPYFPVSQAFHLLGCRYVLPLKRRQQSVNVITMIYPEIQEENEAAQGILPCYRWQTWYYRPVGRMRTPPVPAVDFHDSSSDEPGPSAT